MLHLTVVHGHVALLFSMRHFGFGHTPYTLNVGVEFRWESAGVPFGPVDLSVAFKPVGIQVIPAGLNEPGNATFKLQHQVGRVIQLDILEEVSLCREHFERTSLAQ